MRTAVIRNVTRAADVATECDLADSFWLRLRGLLGRPPLAAGQGMLITPCRAVHMLGMKYSLDVVFLDKSGRVAGLEANLPPGAKSGWYANARHALELPAGVIAASGMEVGDMLSIEPKVGRGTPGQVPEPAHDSNIRIPGAA